MAALMLGRRHRHDGLGVVTTLAKEYGASDGIEPATIALQERRSTN